MCDHNLKRTAEKELITHTSFLSLNTSQLAIRLDGMGNMNTAFPFPPSHENAPVSLGVFGENNARELSRHTLSPTEDCFANDRNHFALRASSFISWPSVFLHVVAIYRRRKIFTTCNDAKNKLTQWVPIWPDDVNRGTHHGQLEEVEEVKFHSSWSLSEFSKNSTISMNCLFNLKKSGINDKNDRYVYVLRLFVIMLFFVGFVITLFPCRIMCDPWH